MEEANWEPASDTAGPNLVLVGCPKGTANTALLALALSGTNLALLCVVSYLVILACSLKCDVGEKPSETIRDRR